MYTGFNILKGLWCLKQAIPDCFICWIISELARFCNAVYDVLLTSTEDHVEISLTNNRVAETVLFEAVYATYGKNALRNYRAEHK